MKHSVCKYFVGLFILVATMSLVACGSDSDNDNDDNDGGSPVETLVGRYTGHYGIHPEIFDVELKIEKVDKNHVRVTPLKADEKGKIPTPKVLKVKQITKNRIQETSFDGFIDYEIDKDVLTISTNKTKETDIDFYYVGNKIK